MSIWVDERLTYQNLIRREKKNRFLHLGTTTAAYLTMIQMPTGNHFVRVEIKAPGGTYDADGDITASVSTTNHQRLRVTAVKSQRQLQIDMD